MTGPERGVVITNDTNFFANHGTVRERGSAISRAAGLQVFHNGLLLLNHPLF